MNLKRSKLLYILEFLQQKSDDEHGVTIADIQRMLDNYGITADRKTLYDDIEVLRDFGLDIAANKGGGTCTYHLLSRDLEKNELKILVDAVQVAKFIPEKKTKDLIRKLEKLTSEYEARELQRQVLISGRVKTEATDNVFLTVDRLHTAINNNVQVSFNYFNWNVKGEKVFRHSGKTYVVSPWALVWEDENYYLVAFHEGILKHFRVDKMTTVNVLTAPREGEKEFDASDFKHLSRSMFRMFHGEKMNVTLDCANDAAGIIIDQFGRDHIFTPAGPDRFHINVTVYFSHQFIAWLLALGDKVKLTSPQVAVEKIREFIENCGKLYQ